MVRNRRAVRANSMSYLDGHDLADHDIGDDLENDGAGEHFDAERRAAIDLALGAARQGNKPSEGNKPWVLDPVFIERSPARAEFAQNLVGRGPTVVRLNHAEFAALAVGDALADDVGGGLVMLNSIAPTGSGGPGRHMVPSQTPYYHVLVKGERPVPKPGRADDFSWPRP